MGTAISFSGAGSNDPQGQTLTYAWSFGDSSTGTGASPSHTYTAGGVYTVSLTVTDTSGLTGTATSKATILSPPTANAGGPYSGVVGSAISFSGATSSDPQSQTLTYAWNFGDNTTGTGTSATHTYAAGGVYTVSLTVTDTSGLTGTATAKATVLAPPVANAGGPYSATLGTAISFNGATSSDPQGQTLTYAWNFGDSTTGTGASASHTYASAGTYTVTLTVADTSGLTGTTTVKATTGLADTPLTGTVMSGTQPLSGAHVYLLAANTTGYGGAGIAASSSNASISLLNVALTGTSDSLGAYVTTNSGGAFSVAGDYTCATGQQLYLYVTGAAGAAWMAAVGACPGTSGAAITATVNEVSTVVTAYAVAGFATDATHVSSSGTTLAQTGIANAFANVTNLETLSTGVALTTTPARNGTVPQAEINTLANILASCSSGGAQCATLFASATADGTPSGVQPTETATAAINIAHNPGANVSALYALTGGRPPIAPTLTGVPNDFTVGLVFTGGGLSNPLGIAIDGQGNAWVTNALSVGGRVSKFSSTGAALSPSGGFTGGGLSGLHGIAIDGSGNAWMPNEASGSNSLSEFSNAGVALSPSTGYTGGGLNAPIPIAIDAAGQVWTANYQGSVSKFSNTGGALSPSNGFTGGGLYTAFSLAIDGSGNAWIANYLSTGSVSKLSSAGAALSPSAGYTNGVAESGPTSIAIDASGSVWIGNDFVPGSVSKFSNAGAVLSPAGGFTGGGLNQPVSIAIDGAGNVWLVNDYVQNSSASGSVSEFSSNGLPLSPSTGYTGSEFSLPQAISLDGSGDAWIPNDYNSTVAELIGIAAPVITPIAAGLPATPATDGSSKLGTRP